MQSEAFKHETLAKFQVIRTVQSYLKSNGFGNIVCDTGTCIYAQIVKFLKLEGKTPNLGRCFTCIHICKQVDVPPMTLIIISNGLSFFLRLKTNRL